LKTPSHQTHHFTVDVEEYFQVSAFERLVPRNQWGSFESRVVECTLRLLDALEMHQQVATFFVLGWVAQRHPDLVKRLARGGHEIASHGWDHRRVIHETPAGFRESVRRAKTVLEQIVGHSVIGYRAPSFSIVPGYEWALDVLLEEGYAYDSSLFPIRRRGYGYATARRDPFWIERPPGRIAEIPPATFRAGTNLPAAGGAYLRLFPLKLVDAAIRQAERRNAPATLYIHPWEVDPAQPRMDVPLLTRVRHYTGLHKTAGKLEKLFERYRFLPIARTVAAMTTPVAQPANG